MFFFFLLTRTIGVADLALSQQEGEASPSVTLTLLAAKEQVASGLSLACYFLKKKSLACCAAGVSEKESNLMRVSFCAL